MKITEKDVRHVAALAQLKLNETEVETFSRQLSRILEYFEMLRAVETPDAEPAAPTPVRDNVFREDVARPCLSSQQALKNAPAADQACFKVPRIIKG